MHDGLKPRTANAINGFSRHLDWKSRPDGRLPRHVHPGASLEHAAHHHVADVTAFHTGARHGLANDCRAKIDGRDVLELTAKRSDGSATGAQDDSVNLDMASRTAIDDRADRTCYTLNARRQTAALLNTSASRADAGTVWRCRI